MREVSNLNHGRGRRAGWLAVALTLCMLAVAGVTVGPAFELQAARAEATAAHRRAALVDAESARRDAFREARSEERLDAELERLRASLPSGVSNLDVHAALRIAAARHGVVLADLSVGAPRDAELPHAHDAALLRRVDARGRGRADDLFQALATLRAMGAALAVMELSLQRSSGRPEFDFTISLAFFQREPLP